MKKTKRRVHTHITVHGAFRARSGGKKTSIKVKEMKMSVKIALFCCWRVLRRTSFSRTFGCGASKGTFGVYDARRDPGQAPWRCSGHSTSLRWLIFQGVAFRLVEPSIIGVNGKPHNFVVFQQPAALSVFFYPLRSVARATTSAQLVSPLLLPATTELHTASNSNSSSTSLEHHTYPLHLAL